MNIFLSHFLAFAIFLALVAAGNPFSSSSTTSATSKTTEVPWEDTVKNTTGGFPKKSGLCCNSSCRQCTMVACDTYQECPLFGFGCCCPSPPATATNFSANVKWGPWDDNETYTLRKRVLHQLFPRSK